MSASNGAPRGTRRSISDIHIQTDGELVESTVLQPLKKPKMLSTEEAEPWAAAYRSSVDANYRTTQRVPTLNEIILDPPHHFQYNSLDHDQPSIRLVHLHPEFSPEGLLQCSITHGSIDDRYVCLSYVWDVLPSITTSIESGNPDQRLILIDNRHFRIRPNLFDFLWMARHNATRRDHVRERFDLSIPFWIDALCINQLDLSERNHQVEQMGRIYSRALAVHAWLGIIPPLGSDLYNSSAGSLCEDGRTMHIEQIFDHWVRGCLREYNTEYDIVIACHIFQNKYWPRAWVVQEVPLAATCIFWLHTFPLRIVHMKHIRQDILQSSAPTTLSRYATSVTGISNILASRVPTVCGICCSASGIEPVLTLGTDFSRCSPCAKEGS